MVNYCYFFFLLNYIIIYFVFILKLFICFLDINANFHKLEEYSSPLINKSQQQSAKKDTFSCVSR